MTTIAREYRKWKLDHKQWLLDNKKWKGANMKARSALRNLERAVKRHDNEIKTFERKSKAYNSLMNHRRPTQSQRKTLRKAYLKQGRNHNLQSKSRKDIFKIAKAIEDTFRV